MYWGERSESFLVMNVAILSVCVCVCHGRTIFMPRGVAARGIRVCVCVCVCIPAVTAQRLQCDEN